MHRVLPDWKLRAAAPHNQPLRGLSCFSSRSEVNASAWSLENVLSSKLFPVERGGVCVLGRGVLLMKSITAVAVRKESAPVSSPWPWFEGRWRWSRCWLALSSEGCGRLSASTESQRLMTSWHRRRFLWRGWPVLGFRRRNKQKKEEINSCNEEYGYTLLTDIVSGRYFCSFGGVL